MTSEDRRSGEKEKDQIHVVLVQFTQTDVLNRSNTLIQPQHTILAHTASCPHDLLDLC